MPNHILLKDILAIAKEEHGATEENAAIEAIVMVRPKWLEGLARLLGATFHFTISTGKMEGDSFVRKATWTADKKEYLK